MPDLEHIAVAGENWASIAFRYWQDEMLLHRLIEANPSLASICIFDGGERIIIPTVDTEVDKSNLAPWRQ